MTGGAARVERIERLLRERLGAEHVEVLDDSARHAGHAGSRGGAGHYVVTVVSDRFVGLDRLERQRAVYAALGEMFPGEIHALTARTMTPAERRSSGTGEADA